MIVKCFLKFTVIFLQFFSVAYVFAGREFKSVSELSPSEKEEVTCPGNDFKWGMPFDSVTFSKERQALHNRIIEEFLAGKHQDPFNHQYGVLLMGLPGSGKTTVGTGLMGSVLSDGYNKANYVFLSIDNIMLKLPQFQKATHFDESHLDRPISITEAFSLCYGEGLYILKKLREIVLHEHYNFMLETTGNSLDTYESYIRAPELAQYKFLLIYTVIPLAVAEERVVHRAETEGRMVDKPFLERAFDAIHRNYPILLEQFRTKAHAQVYRCNNDVPKGSAVECIGDLKNERVVIPFPIAETSLP